MIHKHGFNRREGGFKDVTKGEEIDPNSLLPAGGGHGPKRRKDKEIKRRVVANTSECLPLCGGEAAGAGGRGGAGGAAGPEGVGAAGQGCFREGFQ